MRIFLIGMPGCGKTTAGMALAKSLDIRFFDTDAEIERDGVGIPQIFEIHGERTFRNMESAVLRTICEREKRAVIATGGGIVERQENVALMRSSGLVIFIDRPLRLILGDIDTFHRPLLDGNVNKLYHLYDRRIGMYDSACHKRLTNDHSLDKLIARMTFIIESVKKKSEM